MYASTDVANCTRQQKSEKKGGVSAVSSLGSPSHVSVLGCTMAKHSPVLCTRPACARSIEWQLSTDFFFCIESYLPPSPPPRRSDRGEAAVASRPRPSLRMPRVPHCLRSRARLARSSIHACRVPRTRQAVLGGCCSVEGERVIWLPRPAKARRSWRRRRGPTRGLVRRVDSRGWRGGDYSLWSCQWVVQASRRRCTVAKARRVGSCAEEHQSRSWRRHALLATRLFALLSKWLKTSSRSLPRLASKFERHSISGGVASALAL